MREKIARFMVGRNGNDRLNVFLLVVGLVAIFLGRIFKSGILGTLFTLLAIASIVFCYCRMFSRNLSKRRIENEKYLGYRAEAESELKLVKQKWTQRKDYRFFRCPSCRTVLRVPRGKGKINIVCRKCGTSFIGKT